MRQLIALLLICLTVLSAYADNTVEVTGPSATLLTDDQSPHADDGNVWAGFTTGEWIIKFIEVPDLETASPPAIVDGLSGTSSPRFTKISQNDAGYNMQNLAQLITGDHRDITLYTPFRASPDRAQTNSYVEIYESGLRIPLIVSYHPEPTATAVEAVIRVYINGGSHTVIGDGYRPAQFDLRLSLTPPIYDTGEFALNALPSSPLTSPHAVAIVDDPNQAKLSLSGTAAVEHSGQRVYLRYRLADFHKAKWSSFAPIATVSAGGTWSGSLPVPRDVQIELDFILAGADGAEYRQHVANTELLNSEDTTDGDYADGAGDFVPNILKRACGIDPAIAIGSSASLTQITPMTIEGETYMAITYELDPTQTDLEVVPEWSPNYRSSPFRSGGVVSEVISTDVITGFNTWRSRAPYPGREGYMRLTVKKISPNKVTIAPSNGPLSVAVSIDPVTVLISESVVQTVSERDVAYNETVASTSYEGGRIITQAPTVTALTPAIATLDGSLNIVRVSDGVARFEAEAYGVTNTVEQDVTSITGSETGTAYLQRFDGSLAGYLIRSIDSRIDGSSTLADNGFVFDTQDHSSPSYVRNPDWWAADCDFTAVSPWNSNSAGRKGGTLITPRHMLACSHWEISVGSTVRFIASDNTVHSRTILARKRHPSYAPYRPDFTLYTLSSDLPAAITPMQILPTDWGDYWSPQDYGKDVRAPGWRFDQEEKGLIADTDYRYNTGVQDSVVTHQYPVDPDRAKFGEPIVLYDSGNPAGLLLGDTPVLSTVWTGGGPGSGTPTGGMISNTGLSMEADLNNMIVSADSAAGVSTVDDLTWPNSGGHYQVKTADFSDWPNFATENYLFESSAEELYVERSLVNGKQSYRMALDDENYKLLTWTGSQWQIDNYIDGALDSTLDTSANDVATPDLATFSSALFVNP